MRTALLTTALMMVATMALADEPTAPATQPEATATEAKPAEQATATTEAATAQTAAVADDKKTPLRPPAGYRPKRINGEQVWCAKLVVLGSKFPKQDCRTEQELRQLELRKAEMRNDVDRTRSICSSDNGACGMD